MLQHLVSNDAVNGAAGWCTSLQGLDGVVQAGRPSGYGNGLARRGRGECRVTLSPWSVEEGIRLGILRCNAVRRPSALGIEAVVVMDGIQDA